MRKRALSAVAAAVALAAAGCGSDGSDASSSRPVADERSEGVGTLDGPSLDGDVEPSETPAETPTQTPAEATAPTGELGFRDGQIDEVAVRLDIIELRRSGGTTALTFQLSTQPAGAGETEASAQVAQTFDDGVGDVTGGEGQDSFTLDGISLIDATNRKRYLVARDAGGVCVCDGNLAATFVEAVGPTSLSATFGAPPVDVGSVDVVIPKFGTFKDVPLS